MKVVGKSNSDSKTCSCTSCIYNSGTDNTSLQKLLLTGSRIDKLYYGKYIPLRERKLLDKLVRTRAVYDDIRAQLVSESASSFQKKAQFKRKSSTSEIDDTEKSSAILELVNLVDKGGAVKSSKLSQCCSCCSCSSKTNLRAHTHRAHRHRHAHRVKHAAETRERKHEFKRNRGVRFKTKHIKSDPCTCTFQFVGLEQKSLADKFKDSKTNLKNKVADSMRKINDSKTKLKEAIVVHTNESIERMKKLKDHIKPGRQSPQLMTLEREMYIEEKTKTQRLKNFATASREKLKSSQTRIKNKLQEGGEKVELQVKKSLEKIKKGKEKIKNVICKCHEGVENVIQKEKALALKIKKDSIRKFKENLHKKQKFLDWTCDDECIPGTCIPEECYENLKIRNRNKQRMVGRHERHSARYKPKMVDSYNQPDNEKIKQKMVDKQQGPDNTTKVSCECPLINLSISPKKSSAGIQVQQNKLLAEKQRRKDSKTLSKSLKIRKANRKSSLSSEQKSSRQAVRIGSSFSFNIEFYKERPGSNNQKSKTKKKSEFSESSVIQFSHQRRNNTKRVRKQQKGSQVQLQKSTKDKQKGHALKRCFCTLKLKPKRRKSTSTKTIGTMSSFKSNEIKQIIESKHVDKIQGLLPYECEPGICIPYKCNPYECLKLQKKRLNAQKRFRSQHSYTSSRKTRSTSSITPKFKPSKAKQVQSAIIQRKMQVQKKERLKPQRIQRRNVMPRRNRNVVSIGSSFSFNIDFYKDTGNRHQTPKQNQFERKSEVHSFTIQPKRDNPVKPMKIKKQKQKKKKKIKTSSTGTDTGKSELSNKTKIRSKATKTKYSHLEPYECEPYTCTPGECDPYVCLERIKRRNKYTREVSLGTYSPESKSTSSYTYSKKSKDVFAQSKPHTKGRKVLAKTKPTRPKRNKPQPLTHRQEKLKNVVSVGSTFSFNIEFAKNISRNDPTVQLSPSNEIVNIKTKKKVKHQGIKLHTPSIDDAITQMDRVKKADKASIVTPMLKRCFCTLNLYKKKKREKNAIYTVNTATIKSNYPKSIISNKSERKMYCTNDSHNSDCNYILSQQLLLSDKNKDSICEKLTLKRSGLHLNPIYSSIETRQSLEINSDFSINVDLVKKTSKGNKHFNELQFQKDVMLQNLREILKQHNYAFPINIDARKTGLSQYLNKCFYTMNIHTDNNPRRKLLPYECEPGVCIPGQCDPYECQKLIMKRLQKGYLRSSGTEAGSRSVTSSQTQGTPTHSHLTNASLSAAADHRDHRERHIRTAKKPGEGKQAVRLGSTFSFDVEFYKKHSYAAEEESKPVSYAKVPKRTRGKQSSIQTRERKMATKYGTRDTDSQYDRHTLRDKASHTLQGMQRCFCTLKLQKKGKMKPRMKTVDVEATEEETISVKTTNRGQNTRPIKRSYDLLPYECEPGICIPGECNPYECLELINMRNRRERGTETPLYKKGTASNTMDFKPRRKSRAIFVQPKRQPVIHSEKDKKPRPSQQDGTRQVVRIGSSFSFNIDFYKDNVGSGGIDKIEKAERPKGIKRHKSQISETARHKRNRKMFTSPSSQSQISQTYRDPQLTKSTNVEPFLKRCFCTLQLKNRDKQKIKREEVRKPQYKSVMTMTKGQKIPTQELLPYECEPGFCIPGECDPYVCLERIKKRNNKSLSTEVASQKSKSIGNSSALKRNKHKKIQFQHVDDQPKRRRDDKYLTPKYESKGERKQMVRIGSNFSFNVEFYKDSGTRNRDISYNDTNISTKVTQQETSYKKPKSKYKMVQERKRARSSTSQTYTKSRSVKSGRFLNLKRCFCTLALRNDKRISPPKEKKNKNKQKPPLKNLNKDVQTTKSTVSVVSTFFKKCLCVLKRNTKKQSEIQPVVNFQIPPQKGRTHKLEPYECEPGVCIPGQCDPYECEKLIRKRLLRENATGTDQLKFHTQSSATPTSKVNYKSRYVKTKPIKTHPKKEYKPRQKPSEDISVSRDVQNRQAVKIGSTFSFDIEFFKHGSAKPFEISPTRITREKDLDRAIAAKHKYRSTRQQSTDNVGRYDASQLATVQTQPSGTETDPFLKRCFCTLQLHKSAARLKGGHHGNRKPLQAPRQKKVTTTKNTTTVSYMTSPHEYPPFKYMKNECDPKKCEEKLRKKRFKSTGQKTSNRKFKTTNQSVTTKAIIPSKSKKIQAKLIENSQKSNRESNRIVEVPRFNNILNRDAVRYGSNISLNIEFYKELLPPMPNPTSNEAKNELKISKIGDAPNFSKQKNKNVPALKSVRNFQSQIEKNKAQNKQSNTANRLKRCFCTLKLQKSKSNSKPVFPQSFEVRRVEVHKNKKINTDKPQKNADMTTILPYRPTKFNKNPSKTSLKRGEKINSKKNIKAKRLTRKKSLEAMYCTNATCTEQSKKGKPKHICGCTDTFINYANVPEPLVKGKAPPKKRGKNKSNLETGDFKSSHSERQPKRTPDDASKLKTSKSVKLSKKDKTDKSKKENPILKVNELEAGDNKEKPDTLASILKKKSKKAEDNAPYVCPKCMELYNVNGKKKNLKVGFKDKIDSNAKNSAKQTKKSKNLCESCNKRIDEKCKYCKSCFKTESVFKTYFNDIIKHVEKLPIKTWIQKLSALNQQKKEEPKPLFDVFLESDSFCILNIDEVNKKVAELSKHTPTSTKRHDDSCRCCICLAKKSGYIPKQKTTEGSPFPKLKKLSKRTCICGSEVCADTLDQMKMSQQASTKHGKSLEPCVCGTPICKRETALLRNLAKDHKSVCSCREEMLILEKKRKAKSEKEYHKRRKVLDAQEDKEDQIRRKYRKKEDQRLEKSIKGNSSDAMLAAESVVDVARLGIKGVTDIFRFLYRCIRDPKHTAISLKDMKDHPGLIVKKMSNVYSDSGVASTARRIKKRVQAMETVQCTKALLEEYPVSNYLLHIADKDPKKRIPRRRKRRKERMDFHCDLFMGSLRKRPYLFIYDRCPWFYPHCLSFLNIWRQFADLMLFLLAVVFWSPCIFAMEMCRAVMCCTVCTG